jgi:hypothetical protein
MKTAIAILVCTIALIFVVYQRMEDKYMFEKTTGTWEGQVMSSVFSYNDEYAIGVMVGGNMVILTNQFKDMFDVPLTHVKFWGTVESRNPLVIHVDGIGY